MLGHLTSISGNKSLKMLSNFEEVYNKVEVDDDDDEYYAIKTSKNTSPGLDEVATSYIY